MPDMDGDLSFGWGEGLLSCTTSGTNTPAALSRTPAASRRVSCFRACRAVSACARKRLCSGASRTQRVGRCLWMTLCVVPFISVLLAQLAEGFED